jgi:protease-4
MKSFFQSFLGTLLAFMLVVGGLLLLFVVMIASMAPTLPTVPSKAVLVLNLSRSLPDRPAEDDTATAIQKAIQGDLSQDLALPSLIYALDRASEDQKISGLFITGTLQSAGSAALLELRQALERFKEKKTIISYNQVWGRRELYLCAGLGELIINPFGVLDITAPSANLTFFANAFRKYGIDVQVTRVGRYKSAVEPFTSDRMSPENRDQVKAYLDEIWDAYKTVIATGRGVEQTLIQQLADTKGYMNAKDALAESLVDSQAYYDEVLDKLKVMTGREVSSRDFPQIDVETYIKVPGSPQRSRNRIAIVVAEGDIVDGSGASGQVGGDSLARELRALRMDKNVKAVVMRVNSPGGSAMASDVIQREVIALKNEKPLVVSMGNTAASGGYWISTYANRIFVQPMTLTGSIGVFGMFPNVQKLAADHGITFDSVQTARLGSPSLLRPMNTEEQLRAQALVDFVYDQFLEKVSESRKVEIGVLKDIAQGRIWTGRKAIELGLADEIGGLDDAIKHAAKLANIEDDYSADRPEAPKPALERFLESLSGSGSKRLAKGQFDEAKNELEALFLRLRSLNDPNGVYAMSPVGIAVR